jgi:hypothetical protein
MNISGKILPMHNAVKCEKCKKLHEVDSEEFVAVYGNICIGLHGGVVGNNIQGQQLKSTSIYCLEPCFLGLFRNAKR